MTIEDKRQFVLAYCGSKVCNICKLSLENGDCRLCIGSASEDELDDAIRIINGVVDSQKEAINHPQHYADGKIEVIDFIEDKNLGFCLGNAVKYIARAGKKDPAKEVEDLKKAEWYIKRRIKEIEEGIV